MSEYDLFFNAVKVAAGSTPVAYPNVAYSGDVDYYKVDLMPGGKIGMGVAHESSNMQTGMCQVSCYVRENVGEIKAVEFADVIILAFPKGTELKDTITVSIDAPAYKSPGLATDGWYMIPVTIPYHIISK